MEPALSRQVKSAGEIKFRKSRRDRARIELASAGDVALSIPTVPFADVGFALGFDSVTPRERDEFVCRAVNVAVAAVALVLLAPLIVLIAVAIKLTTPGPVLYSQVRVGVDRRWRFARSFDRRTHDFGGRLFRMFKFRTMYQNAEPDGQAVWASKRDPRVTVVGRFLRSTRLDELPQLWNVLLGDMNIVGPRPERPTIFAELRRKIPEYPYRQRVKPGITGWAQVNLAYDACIDDVREKVRYDLEYVRRQSVVEDLRIMSMTLPVMLFRRGAH
jgi:lipopolysaccharide/colanic/teichoic acid biosynthesis glycosyltransferase